MRVEPPAGAERTLEMKRKRHAPEQIIRHLRDAEVKLGNRAGVPEVCKELGVSEATFHRWRPKIEVIKRQAYGFRDDDYCILQVKAAFHQYLRSTRN